MSQQEIELTAYCGVYCCDCIRYRSSATDLARNLLSDLQNTEFNKYAELKSSPVKHFKHYRKCCEVLEAIIALQSNNPCRVGGGCSTFSCAILECCRRKRFEGCWQCDDFESCDKFEPLKSIHGDSPLQNLRKIKELGVDSWAEHRSKPYIWQ